MKKSLDKFLKNADQYGQPVYIMYQNKTTHNSRMGGVLSILSTSLILYYFTWRISLWTGNDRDEYVSVAIQTDLMERDPLLLKDSDVDFRIYLDDPNFDNKNNSYGEFKLHLYNSMNGTQLDIIIPLKDDCSSPMENDTVWNVVRSKIYCPDFSDEHFLKNDHESVRNSWMRLALHECDPKKMGEGNCSNKTEINEYFRKNIISMYAMTVKPNLKNYKDQVPLFKKFKYFHYGVREQTDLLMAHEILVMQSSMEIDDDRTGLNDHPHEYEFQEVFQKELKIIKYSYQDAVNIDHADLLMYWNFLLTEDQINYERTRYKMIDIFGEIGGIMSILASMIVIILSPWNYKKHEINVFKEYHNQHKHCKQVPDNLNRKLFVHNYLPCISRCIDKDAQINSEGGSLGNEDNEKSLIQQLKEQIDDVVENQFDLKNILRLKTVDDEVTRVSNLCKYYDADLQKCCDKLNILRKQTLFQTQRTQSFTTGKKNVCPFNTPSKQNYYELPQTTAKKGDQEKVPSDHESTGTIQVKQIKLSDFKTDQTNQSQAQYRKSNSRVSMSNKKFGLAHEKIVKLKKAFNELDVNRDGVISRDELKYMFQSINVNYKDEDLEHFFKKHDSNADDKIQFEEFINAILEGDLQVN